MRAQCWTFRCIQCFRFLSPRINDHLFYASVVEAGRSAHANQLFMVSRSCQLIMACLYQMHQNVMLLPHSLSPECASCVICVGT